MKQLNVGWPCRAVPRKSSWLRFVATSPQDPWRVAHRLVQSHRASFQDCVWAFSSRIQWHRMKQEGCHGNKSIQLSYPSSPRVARAASAESEASGEPATNLAREALSDWLKRRRGRGGTPRSRPSRRSMLEPTSTWTWISRRRGSRLLRPRLETGRSLLGGVASPIRL